MNRPHVAGSASSSELIDAKLEEHRMSCGSNHCPSCGHKLGYKPDWVGLPAGVKFDPTDQELMEHLEAKAEEEGSRSHPLIDEFIPTIEGEDGICYTHPEKLPGVTRDGLSKHFFHRPSKAYTTGTRKRRKIQAECELQSGGETRWHKTGKTRPVMVGGRQKGCKKILVLYTNFGKHRKPEKTNWVMHQYHLGELEEEKEGELVVSKIFYQTQPRQSSAQAAGDGGGSGSSRETAGPREEIMSGYGTVEIHEQHMKPADNFSFSPFRESFEEVGMGEEVPTKARELHEEHSHQHRHGVPHDQHMSRVQHCLSQPAPAAAFLVNRPTDSVSTIVSPVQLASVGLGDPYHAPGIILQTQKLDQRRSSSGLEELIMGCTSGGAKGEASNIPNSQESEWQYSYWSPHDHQDHHG